MKFLQIMVLVFVSMTASAQQSDNLAGLSPLQIAELRLAVEQKRTAPSSVSQVMSDITSNDVTATLSSFANIGKETGVAVREGLNAVVDVADKFSGSPVGKITIALVIWRVVGEDIL